MAGLWRGVRGWVGGKNAELSRRNALLAAIQSGEEEEILVALSLARHECVQWKGGLAMSHDQMSSTLYKYLTDEFPKVNRRDKEEEAFSPVSLAASLGHEHIVKKLKREIDKYYSVARIDENAKKKHDAHRGRSTNDRANEARARLKDMQRHRKQETAEEEEEATEEAQKTSSAQNRIEGRYHPKASS